MEPDGATRLVAAMLRCVNILRRESVLKVDLSRATARRLGTGTRTDSPAEETQSCGSAAARRAGEVTKKVTSGEGQNDERRRSGICRQADERAKDCVHWGLFLERRADSEYTTIWLN